MTDAPTDRSGRWRRLVATERRLASIAAAVVGSSLVSSALGLVFWMLAARGMAPAGMGMLGATTAAMGFLGTIGCMGLGQLLIGELPRTPAEERRELFVVMTVTAAVVGAILGAGFGVVAGAGGGTWTAVRAPGQGWWWLVVGTALTSLSMVLDNAMLVIGRPTMQVWRNTVAGGWKVALLAVALPLAAVDVDISLAAWVTGLALGAALSVRAAMTALPGRRTVPPRRVLAVLAGQARATLGNQGLNLALTASWAILPTRVAWVISPAENGVYTTVRLAAAQAALLPYALSMALFAASADEGYDPVRGRRVLLTSLGLSLALYAVVAGAAPIVLWFFGSHYVDAGVPYLREMALGAPLLVFKDQYIAQARVLRPAASLVPLLTGSAVLEIGLAWAGALRWHLGGAIGGWLLALAVQAVLLAPRLPWRVRPATAAQASDQAAPEPDPAISASEATRSASSSMPR